MYCVKIHWHPSRGEDSIENPERLSPSRRQNLRQSGSRAGISRQFLERRADKRRLQARVREGREVARSGIGRPPALRGRAEGESDGEQNKAREGPRMPVGRAVEDDPEAVRKEEVSRADHGRPRFDNGRREGGIRPVEGRYAGPGGIRSMPEQFSRLQRLPPDRKRLDREIGLVDRKGNSQHHQRSRFR